MIVIEKSRHKKNGSILIQAVLASIIFMMLASSFVSLYGGQFTLLDSGKTALKAQQYAEISANTLTLTPYDELSAAAHGKKNIEGASGWQDEVIIGSEKTIGSDNKQRIGTVTIYKTGDTLPRYSLQVPLSSQDNGTLPKGTIVPYSGDLSKLPHGWALCDGKNGNPNLRGRFLIGSGDYVDVFGATNYILGSAGGERLHQLSQAEMPKHQHFGDGPFKMAGWDASGANSGSGTAGWGLGLAIGDNPPYDGVQYLFKTGYSGDDQAHNNMPPYFTVHWIIKI